MLPLGLSILATSLLVTLAALYGMGRRRAVGDESEYLERASQDDAFGPRPFLRMPLLIWIATRCGAEGEDRLRLVIAVLSVLTVALTALTGWYLGGVFVAAIASLLLLLQPERTLLACHIWPDGLVALAVAAITLLLVLPSPSGASLLFALGVACALGVLARIDFVIVPPAVLASLLYSGQEVDELALVLLFFPSLSVLASWTLRNFRRYGIALPDSTWTFNLLVTETESERAVSGDFAIEPIIGESMSQWRVLSEKEHGNRARKSFGALARRPFPFLRSAGRRFLTLCGPDTFLRQKVLPRKSAYPELGDPLRRGLELALRVAFPLLLTLVVVGGVTRRELPAPYSWPAFSLLVMPTLFLARTRYRLALLPALSLLASEGLAALPEGLRSDTFANLTVLLSAPLLFWALLRIRCSREIPP